MVALPVDWLGCENTIHDWIVAACGLSGSDVRFQQTRDSGPSRGAPPKALITLLSIAPLSQQMRTPMPQVMQARVTVIAEGPGEVGIDFYPDTSATPQRISITAGAGEAPDLSAAALLVALLAELPAGYVASLDPDNSAAVLIEGTEGEPLFALAAADPTMTEVAETVPRLPDFVAVQHLVVWRIDFRALAVSGSAMAANAMSLAMTYRASHCDPQMRALGFRSAGWRGSTPSVPADRADSLAVLDAAWIGLFTGAVAKQAMRRAGFTQTAA